VDSPPQLFLSQHHRNCRCPTHDAASSRHGWGCCTTAHKPPPQLSSPAGPATGGRIYRLPGAGGDNQRNIRTISDFREIHLKTLEGLFEQVLKIALEARALKVGRVAPDGTKIKANASTHKAMSHGQMKRMEKDLCSQIKDLLAQAEAADAEEDAATSVPDPCDTPPRRRMIRRELNTPTQ
jgi:hypothetical protein